MIALRLAQFYLRNYTFLYAPVCPLAVKHVVNSHGLI